MKRFVALFVSILLIFSVFVVSVDASEEKPTVSIEITRYVIDLTENLMGRSFAVPVVGYNFVITLRLENFDASASGNVKLSFNEEVISYIRQIRYASADTENISMLNEKSKVDGCVDFEAVVNSSGFLQSRLIFHCNKIGECNIDLAVSDFVDVNGESADVCVVKKNIASRSHYYTDIPTVGFDGDKCIAYGSLGQDPVVELAYPMSASEYLGKKYDCELRITDVYGNELSVNDTLSTGATMSVWYDNAPVYTVVFVLLGDVNGDGDISAADARAIMRHSAKIETIYDRYKLIAANTCQSIEITSRDARAVLRYAAMIEDGYVEWFRYHQLLHRYDPDVLVPL